MTPLNADSNDTGSIGPESVEVYLPLVAGSPAHRVGVLEVYLPYAPIQIDIDADIDNLYRNLAIGLALLYVVLFGISLTVGRKLRRQVKVNAYMAEHDALTNLPNRALFHRRVQDALRRGRPPVVPRRLPSSTWTGSRRSMTRSATTTATGC